MRASSLNLYSIDILTASPHYFCKKCMETQKENLLFDTRAKGLKHLQQRVKMNEGGELGREYWLFPRSVDRH